MSALVKINVWTLRADIHNSGIEVYPHGTEVSLREHMKEIIEDCISHAESFYGSDYGDEWKEQAKEMRELIETGEIEDAFALLNDSENGVKHSDDWYAWEQHEIEIYDPAEALRTALHGCRDMLNESAKQHRQQGDNGHARGCTAHIYHANEALA